MFKRIFLSLAVFALLAAAPAQAQNGPAGGAAVFDACPDPASEPSDVPTPCLAIVSFEPAVSRDGRAVIVRGAGAAVRFNFTIVGAAAVLVPNEAAYWALADDSDVTAFTPDRRVEAFAKPDNPGNKNKDGGGDGGRQTLPSGVDRIGADLVLQTGFGVGVAIVDTGLDFSHADLDIDVADPCFDAFGVAPGAMLYAVRVLDASGGGTDATVIAGLEWVVDNAGIIDVVNMSLGRPGTIGDNPAMHAAVQAVVDAGVTMVVAAGNHPFSEISQMVPASYPEVMAIASTTASGGTNKCRSYSGTIRADTASYFTTDGGGVAISAPGARQENISRGCRAQSVGILSLKAGGGTTQMSGTSMAAPHVAGVVALVKEACAALTPGGVRGIIGGSAELVGTAPTDSPTGGYSYDGMREGIVDAVGAVNDPAIAAACP